MTAPDAFLGGKLVDESGVPPLTACFTVIAEGNCRGQRGFVPVHGDQMLRPDGTFISPPLDPGRYFLRFFGMLRCDPASRRDRDLQRYAFDFIYPNADTVSDALHFDLRAGETLSWEFKVPAPVWFNIAGRIDTRLPSVNRGYLSILFRRKMGILPNVGAIGIPVKRDGSFEGMLLVGSYDASLHEMADPDSSHYTRSVRCFGSTEVTIREDALTLALSMQ